MNRAVKEYLLIHHTASQFHIYTNMSEREKKKQRSENKEKVKVMTEVREYTRVRCQPKCIS